MNYRLDKKSRVNFRDSFRKELMKNVKQIFQYRVKLKGELRPRTHPCFYGIILMILWKKRFVQSFVVFWSVLTKLWSYKVFNPAWVTPYPPMYKTLQPWFSWHTFVDFMEKNFLQFYGCFDHFLSIYYVAKFWMIKSWR